MNVKRLTRGAVLCTLALVLSLVEQHIPLGLAIPLPGIRLGLSNIVTLFALFCLGAPDALAIQLLRVGVLFLITGNFTSFCLSFTGSMLALAVMLLLKGRGYGKFFSIYGVSIAGAAAHNIGQIAAASLLLKTSAVFYYIPVLMVAAAATGALTAFISSLLIGSLYKAGAVSKIM